MSSQTPFHDKLARDLDQFRDLMARASSLAEQASKLAHLPELERTQALAAMRCAGGRLYRITGVADEWTASAVISDLEFVVERIAEPLLSALANQAAENFNEVERDHFKNHLSDALSDTRGELTDAAESMRVSRDDTEAEFARGLRAAE